MDGPSSAAEQSPLLPLYSNSSIISGTEDKEHLHIQKDKEHGQQGQHSTITTAAAAADGLRKRKVDQGYGTASTASTTSIVSTSRFDGSNISRDYSEEEERSSSTDSTSHKNEQTQIKHGFDLLFVKRLWRLSRIIFKSFSDKPALWLSVILGLSLAEQVIIYIFGLVPSRFYSILQRKDTKEFTTQVINCLILVLAMGIIKCSEAFVTSQLYLQYRRILTNYLHKIYFGPSCYEINNLDKRIDNSDQRIAQDVDKFSNVFSSIIAKLIIVPLTIIYYTYQSQDTMGYIGPLAVYGFFIVGTICNKIIMSFIVPYVFQQEKLEGDFRYIHTHIRAGAESVAFYHGQLREKQNVTKRFEDLIAVQYKIVNRSVPLNLSITLFDYGGSILSYIIIAIPIFAGKYDNNPLDISSIISQSSFISMYLVNCFSTIIDLSNDLGNLAGYTHRIGELVEVFNETNEKKKLDFEQKHSSPPSSQERKSIVFNKVSYETPQNKSKLVSDLTLVIEQNMNVQVVGSSGCGKSSLLRILNDLWPISSGTIFKPSAIGKDGLFYLPQVPYVSDGTLRDLLYYPNESSSSSSRISAEDISLLSNVFLKSSPSSSASTFGGLYDVNGAENALIFAILDTLKLSHIIARAEGLDTWHNWTFYDSLSPGEKQRLAFAGLFLHRPTFAILDESTSAISIDMEARIYELCHELSITTFSIAHRSSLMKFHNYLLILDGATGWKLQKIEQPVD